MSDGKNGWKGVRDDWLTNKDLDTVDVLNGTRQRVQTLKTREEVPLEGEY